MERRVEEMVGVCLHVCPGRPTVLQQVPEERERGQ